MAHSTKFWSGPVVLLTDAPPPTELPGVEVVDFRAWFDSSAFDSAIRLNEIDQRFRSGFFAKTLQRFFVLEQFAVMEGLDAFAHAELDVVLFGADSSTAQLARYGSGIFVPWFPGKYAIGSFVYVNNLDALTRLNQRALEPPYTNEMELLQLFLAENSDCAFGLPTVDQQLSGFHHEEKIPPNLLTEKQVGGLFDAARLGQWVFGIDPRNVAGRFSWNKYRDWGKNRYPAQAVILSADRRNELSLRLGSLTHRVFNMHIHSKSLLRATDVFLLNLYFSLARLPFRVPIHFKSIAVAKVLDNFYRLVNGNSGLRNLWNRVDSVWGLSRFR